MKLLFQELLTQALRMTQSEEIFLLLHLAGARVDLPLRKAWRDFIMFSPDESSIESADYLKRIGGELWPEGEETAIRKFRRRVVSMKNKLQLLDKSRYLRPFGFGDVVLK